VRFTTALTDRRGTALAAEFNSTFTTQAQPPVAITALSPGTVVAGTQVTISGSGFDPTPGAINLVALSPIGFGLIDTLVAGFVTPTSLVVQIPPGTAPVPFEVRVVVNEQTNVSNPLTLNIVLPPAQASPTASGAAVPVGFTLNDVAVTDAGAVFAAGDGGLVYIAPAANSATAVSSEPTQSVALTPDGRLLVATQPVRGRLQVFDADPSGSPGTLLATIPVDGAPFGVAVSPTGQRAYATDEDTTVVHEIDLRAGSATRFTVVGVRALPPGAIGPNGGIAVDPRNDRYYLTTATGTWSLATDGSASLLTSAVGPGVTATPSGAQVIVPTPSAGLQLAPAASVTTGGAPRDVVVTPLGQSALVANSVLNQLQVVNLTPLSPTYLRVVGGAPTGDTPVAVSISTRGDIVAVANRASRTVSRYTLNTGTTPALQRVVGEVALPGEIVGVQGDGASGYATGTQVDLGGTFLTPVGFAGTGSALAARIPALTQRQTSLAVQRSDGTRSLSLPFTVVEPVGNTASRPATSIALPDTSIFGEAVSFGQVRFARVSPDGRKLAVMQLPQVSFMSLFAIGDDEPAHGRYLGAVPAGGTSGDPAFDAAFTPDGRRLWVNGDGQFFRIYDVDPASGTFGQSLAQVPSSSQGAVVTDPLGRYVITSNGVDNTIPLQIWMPAADSLVAAIPVNADGLAATPDGRRVLAQAGFRMHFLQLEPPQLLQTYNKPGSTGDAYEAVAVTRDGRYGFAIGNPRVGAPEATFFTVWNLDPQFGEIGQVLYSKTAADASLLDGRRWLEAWPGPTANSILLGAADGTVWIVALQPSGLPVVTLSLSGIPDVRGLAVTPAARRLYLPAGGQFTATPGRVEVLNLSDATAAALVSGDGQTGLAGSVLPNPVRVRVTDGAGRPQFGVLVRFELGVNEGVIAGSGGLATVEQVTDANGEAEVSWQLPAFGPTLITSATMDVRVLGVSGQPVLVAGATIAQDDSQVAPVVLQLSPADGATGLNATTPVAVRFNQKMAPGVTGVIELRVNDAPVQGDFRLEDEGRLVLFQPFAPLPYGATCRLSVAGGVVTDTDGQLLADGATASFTVQAAPAVNVTTITPPSGPAGASVVIGGMAFSTTPGGNAVLFNGASAVVSDATESAITASVPLAATTGPVQVVVGSTTATGPDFVVLPANPVPGGAVGDLQDVDGIREMAVTADGLRGYVTNPTTNTVTALDLLGATTLTRITVGLRPQGVAILPEPQRAYVANTGSNNLSVIDIDPASPAYHTVVKSITVEEGPIDVVVSPVGPRVYVLNQAAGSLSVIDANAGNATYDQVVTTVKTGSGGQNVAVSPDGTVAYIAAAEGLIVVDLLTNAVVTTVKTGSGGQNVAVTPDGTIVLLLLTNGDLLAISVAPGASQYQVVTTVKTGSGGQTVAVSPDGSLAYVTDGDGDQVLVFEIVKGTTADASTFLPVPSLSLVRVATIPVGEAPAGIAVDPTGSGTTYVMNSGSGTVTVIGRPTGPPPPVVVSFRFSPRTVNLKAIGLWVTGTLEPPAPFTVQQIDVSSLLLNGKVKVAPFAPRSFCDSDDDGLLELTVRFRRWEVEPLLAVGDQVPITLTGTIGDRELLGVDTIKVIKQGRVFIQFPQTTMPTEPSAPPPVAVRWVAPEGVTVQWVSVFSSSDRGDTWTLVADREANDGSYDWRPAGGGGDSLKLAVAFVLGERKLNPAELAAGLEDYEAIVVESDFFTLDGIAQAAAPAVLTFAPVTPNPSRGAATLRFGLPQRTRVTLEIFDLQGRRVRTVFDGERTAGWHSLSWKGDGESGGSVGAGLYFARLKAAGQVLDQRLVLIR
jgi:DNA-binding beta-propeller fold protein YncE